MKTKMGSALIALILLSISLIFASCGGGKKDNGDAAAALALLNTNQPYTPPRTFNEFLEYMAPCLGCHSNPTNLGGNFNLASYTVVAGNPKGSSSYTDCANYPLSFLWKVVQTGGALSPNLGHNVDMSRFAAGNPTSAIRDWISAGCPN